jgi:hypothetical protein
MNDQNPNVCENKEEMRRTRVKHERREEDVVGIVVDLLRKPMVDCPSNSLLIVAVETVRTRIENFSVSRWYGEEEQVDVRACGLC